MIPQTMRIVIGVFCLSLWSCAWGATTMNNATKESSIAASDRQVSWLDNTHVVFHGFTGGEGSPGHESPLTNRGTYVWDLDRGTVTREPRFDRASLICSREPYLSYIEHTEDMKSSKRRAYEKGKEIALPEKFWFNPMNCRTYATQPPWMLEGRAMVPLLEEHGYIDRGPKGQDQIKHFPLLYYHPGAAQPIPLGLGSQDIEVGTIKYAPFLDAYVLEGSLARNSARPLWLLHPNGTVEQIFTPEGKTWADLSWPWLELTQRGPVFASLHPRGPHSADAGLYLWAGDVLMHVADGFFTMHAISPDGCKLAAIKSRPERPLPTAELHRLQIIDICNGGNDVH